MGRDSTKGDAQTGEVLAGDSSKKTAIACKACGNMYENNHAFAGHRRDCKSTKEPEQNAIELAEDQRADKMVDRNSEEVTSKSDSQITETESTRSLAVTSPEKDCKFTNGLELNAEGQAGALPARKIRKPSSWGRNLMDGFGFAGHRRDCKSTKEPEQNVLKLAEDQSTDKMADRNSEEVTSKSGSQMTETECDSTISLAVASPEKDCKFTNGLELNVEGQVGASPARKIRKPGSWGRNFMDGFGSASHRRDCKSTKEPEQNALKLAEDQRADKMVDRYSEEVTSKSGSQMTETECDSTRSLAVTSPEKDCKFTNGLELNAEGQAGATPARKIRKPGSWGRNFMDGFGSGSHRKDCKSTKEPEKNALKPAKDQRADKMVDRYSEEVTSKSGSQITETECDSTRSLAVTSAEKDCKFTNGLELNAEGQVGASPARKIRKPRSWGRNFMDRFGSASHRRDCKSTKEPEKNALKPAEDQRAGKMVDRYSEEVTSKSVSQIIETECDSSRSLAVTSPEKDCKFTNGLELNAEGQAGASQARKIRKPINHRRDCKSTKEPEQNALKLAEDQSTDKMADRNSEEVIAKWGGLISEAEWDTVESLLMLQYSTPSLADDDKVQLSSRSLAATSVEKDYKSTNGPELNAEGQAGASPAVKIWKCDSCGRNFRRGHALAGHRAHCKYTKEQSKMP